MRANNPDSCILKQQSRFNSQPFAELVDNTVPLCSADNRLIQTAVEDVITVPSLLSCNNVSNESSAKGF